MYIIYIYILKYGIIIFDIKCYPILKWLWEYEIIIITINLII